jgi:hypothetical protein
LHGNGASHTDGDDEMQNFNRLPIISDTTRTVRPVSMDEVYGDDAGGGWTIGVSCPVNGKYLSSAWFETREDAMKSIESGEY